MVRLCYEAYFVFEEAYQKSYLPFIEILERHPKIRIAIHFTGILLDWIKQHPEVNLSGLIQISLDDYIKAYPKKDKK